METIIPAITAEIGKVMTQVITILPATPQFTPRNRLAEPTPKIEHEATWVRTSDDSTYAFDWHATLRLRDPMISTEDDFVKAQNATHFVLFDGFA